MQHPTADEQRASMSAGSAMSAGQATGVREPTRQMAAAGQHVVGDEEHEHAHPAVVHTHDHYHVSHHHTGGVLGQFEHRTHYHEHEHNHGALVHAHNDRGEDAERLDHESTAHTHDHDSPTGGGR
jgi:hypothetical protein